MSDEETRLKQLMGQCYETGPIGRDGWPEYSKLNEGKFAELIVEECADLVDRAISDGGVDGRVVKEHFGVEE